MMTNYQCMAMVRGYHPDGTVEASPIDVVPSHMAAMPQGAFLAADTTPQATYYRGRMTMQQWNSGCPRRQAEEAEIQRQLARGQIDPRTVSRNVPSGRSHPMFPRSLWMLAILFIVQVSLVSAMGERARVDGMSRMQDWVKINSSSGGHEGASGSQDERMTRVAEIAFHSVSQGSRDTYDRWVKRWMMLCEVRKVSPILDANVNFEPEKRRMEDQALAEFSVFWIDDQKLGIGSLGQALSAVASWHTELGYVNVTSGRPLLSLVKKGLAKLFGAEAEGKTPVDPNTLLAAARLCEEGEAIALLRGDVDRAMHHKAIKTALTTGWTFLLRFSELVCTKDGLSKNWGLRMGDLTMHHPAEGRPYQVSV